MPARQLDALAPGDGIDPLALVDIHGQPVAVPDPARLVHLQFRRFAGCPVCNLHLRSIVRRHEEIVAAGVVEVVVFHSTAEDLLPHAHDLPFAVVADPAKDLYRRFGVESSPRSLLDPRTWPAIVRGVAVSAGELLRRRRPSPPLRPAGGRYGLPADLLVTSDGTVAAAKYGDHASDQWSVDEVLDLAARPVPAPRPQN